MTDFETYKNRIKNLKSDKLRNDFLKISDIKELALFLEVPINKLNYHLYKSPADSRYKTFEIPKKSGGSRIISAPATNLKIIQKKLNVVLQKIYSLNRKPSAHGFLNDKSIITNAEKHCRSRLVLNMDIKDFFPSINFGRVRGMFLAAPYKMNKKVATVLAQVCCHDNYLPQGAPTSPIITNMLCAKMDDQFQRLADNNKCVYTRYADDITISTNLRIFPEAIVHNEGDKAVPGKEITRIIAENGFEINSKKTRIQNSQYRQEVTGLTVNEFLNVKRKYVREIRAMLHAWEKYGLNEADKEYGQKYNNKNSQSFNKHNKKPLFQQVLKGKIDFLGMVRGKDNEIYHKYFKKYCKLSEIPTIKSLEIDDKLILLKKDIFDFMNNHFIESNKKIASLEIIQEKIEFFEAHLEEIYRNSTQIKSLVEDMELLKDHLQQLDIKQSEQKIIPDNTNVEVVLDKTTKDNFVCDKNLQIQADMEKLKMNLSKEINKLKNAIHFGIEPENFDFINQKFYKLIESLQYDNQLMKKSRRLIDFARFCGYVWKQVESSSDFLIQEIKLPLSKDIKEEWSNFSKVVNHFKVELKCNDFIIDSENFYWKHEYENPYKNGHFLLSDYVRNCRNQSFHGDYKTPLQRMDLKIKVDIEKWKEVGKEKSSNQIQNKEKALNLRKRILKEENYTKIEESLYIFLSTIFKGVE